MQRNYILPIYTFSCINCMCTSTAKWSEELWFCTKKKKNLRTMSFLYNFHKFSFLFSYLMFTIIKINFPPPCHFRSFHEFLKRSVYLYGERKALKFIIKGKYGKIYLRAYWWCIMERNFDVFFFFCYFYRWFGKVSLIDVYKRNVYAHGQLNLSGLLCVV